VKPRQTSFSECSFCTGAVLKQWCEACSEAHSTGHAELCPSREPCDRACVYAELKVETPCAECGHALERHQAQEGMCLDCRCMGWETEEQRKQRLLREASDGDPGATRACGGS
jgi:hypothetical protein